MVEPISIRQLVYLIKVIETGSMTHAATELNVSQPALGLQIKNLEETVGVQLLSRHSRGVAATAAGRYLYDRSKMIVDLLQQTRIGLGAFSVDASNRAAVERERISVGITPSIVRQIGSSILVDAQIVMPNVLLNIVESFSKEMEQLLLANDIDIGFAFDVDAAQFPQAVPILDENFVFYTDTSTGADEADIPARQALQNKLVLQNSHEHIRRMFEGLSKEHGVPLQIPFDVHSPNAIRSIVESRLAAGIVPFGAVAEVVRSGKGRVRRIVEPEMTRRLFVVRAPGGHTFENERAMSEFLKRASEKIIESLGRFGKRVPAIL